MDTISVKEAAEKLGMSEDELRELLKKNRVLKKTVTFLYSCDEHEKILQKFFQKCEKVGIEVSF